MKWASFLLVAVLAMPAFGDQVDEAEAKRRGVAVEVILLEKEKAKSAALQQQVEELKQQVAELKRQLAAATSTPAAPSPSDRIAAAIKSHTIIDEMTLADVKKSIDGDWKKEVEDTNGEVYLCYRLFSEPSPRQSNNPYAPVQNSMVPREVAWVRILNGKAIKWRIDTEAITAWEQQQKAMKR